MIFEIEEVNKSMMENEDIVVGSLDVVKWYPSMEIKRLIEIIMELMMEADLDVGEIDFDQLGIYIATSLTKEEIRNADLEKVVPKRKERKRAGITNKDIWLTEGDKCQWEVPERKPNKLEKQKMFTVGICIGVKLIMENHIYRFAGELRKQKSVGPIGIELTGALTDLFMLYWDRKFLNKLKDLDIQVKGYKRFKDDTNIMLRPVDRKLKYEENEMVMKTTEEMEKENKFEKDEVTMKTTQTVADSIEKMIKTEVDFPSNKKNPEKKMAILDIGVWVQKIESENRSIKNQIFYEFFEKPMSSKFVIMRDSAAPLSQKRTVLTQEGIRTLKNFKKELDWDQKAKHLDNFMQKMKNSGYDEKFRLEVLKSSINGYEKILEDGEKGVKPVYRNKEWKEKNDWNKKKVFNKENW